MEVHYQPAVESGVPAWDYTVHASRLISLSFHGSARNRRAVCTYGVFCSHPLDAKSLTDCP